MIVYKRFYLSTNMLVSWEGNTHNSLTFQVYTNKTFMDEGNRYTAINDDSKVDLITGMLYKFGSYFEIICVCTKINNSLFLKNMNYMSIPVFKSLNDVTLQDLGRY